VRLSNDPRKARENCQGRYFVDMKVPRLRGGAARSVFKSKGLRGSELVGRAEVVERYGTDPVLDN